MNFLIKDLEKLKKFSDYTAEIVEKRSPIVLSGLSSVGKIQLIEATKEYTDENICIITYNEIQARKIIKDLQYFSNNVLYFPKREIASYDYIAENKDLPYERIDTLNKIYAESNKKIVKNKKVEANNRLIIVTTVEALMQKMIKKEDMYNTVLEFSIGKNYNQEDLKHNLLNLGYERTDIVDGKGQFAIRGGIVDIGTTKNQGIRIEFWGDEVDSIRSFSITSQRSIKMINEATVYPSHELILTRKINEICDEIEKNILEKTSNEEIEKNIREDLELMKSGDYISKIDKYFNIFYKEQNNFLEYINDNYLLMIDDINKINARQENIIKDNINLIETLSEKNRIVPDSIKNIDKIQVEEVKLQKIYLYETDLFEENTKINLSVNKFNFKYRDVHFFKSELNLLATEIKKALIDKRKIIILAGNEQGAKKIEELLELEDIKYKYIEKLEETGEKIY